MKKLILVSISVVFCSFKVFSADVDIRRGGGTGGSATNAQPPSAVLTNLANNAANTVTNANINQFTIGTGILNFKANALITNTISRGFTNFFGESGGINVTNREPSWYASADGVVTHHAYWVDQFGRDIIELRRDILTPITNGVIYIGGQQGLGGWGAITLNTFWRGDEIMTNTEARITLGFTREDGNQDAVFRFRPGLLELGHEDYFPGSSIYALYITNTAEIDFGSGDYYTHINGARVLINPEGTGFIVMGNAAGFPAVTNWGTMYQRGAMRTIGAFVSENFGTTEYSIIASNKILVGSNLTIHAGGPVPQDGSPSVGFLYHSNTNGNKLLTTVGLAVTQFPNSAGGLSNNVFAWGPNPWGISNAHARINIIWEDYYNTGTATQMEFYVRCDKQGSSSDIRPLFIEWTTNGALVLTRVAGPVRISNTDHSTNWMTFDQNFQHTMIAEIFSINGPNSGRAEVRYKQRSSETFYNTDNSLSYSFTGHPDERSMWFIGNNSGATNFIFQGGSAMALHVTNGIFRLWDNAGIKTYEVSRDGTHSWFGHGSISAGTAVYVISGSGTFVTITNYTVKLTNNFNVDEALTKGSFTNLVAGYYDIYAGVTLGLSNSFRSMRVDVFTNGTSAALMADQWQSNTVINLTASGIRFLPANTVTTLRVTDLSAANQVTGRHAQITLKQL